MMKRVLGLMMCTVMSGTCSAHPEEDQALERTLPEFRAMIESQKKWMVRSGEINKLNVNEHRGILEKIAQDEKEDISARALATRILNPDCDVRVEHNTQTLVLTPKPPPLTEEEMEEEESDMFRHMMSLGQLCKTSDLIIVGKLTGRKKKADGETEYTFRIERVLDGKIRARTIAVHGYEEALHAVTLRQTAINSTCLFFCSHIALHKLDDDPKLFSLSFEKAKLPWRVSKWFITMNNRGVIQVDARTADAYEQAVQGHLKHIRSKNVFEYFDFLRGLAKSDIVRIRKDALADLKSLTRHSASEDDLAKILEYPGLTDEEKAIVHNSLANQQHERQMREEAKRKKAREEKQE